MRSLRHARVINKIETKADHGLRKIDKQDIVQYCPEHLGRIDDANILGNPESPGRAKADAVYDQSRSLGRDRAMQQESA